MGCFHGHQLTAGPPWGTIKPLESSLEAGGPSMLTESCTPSPRGGHPFKQEAAIKQAQSWPASNAWLGLWLHSEGVSSCTALVL